jgi:hypothetical protein
VVRLILDAAPYKVSCMMRCRNRSVDRIVCGQLHYATCVLLWHTSVQARNFVRCKWAPCSRSAAAVELSSRMYYWHHSATGEVRSRFAGGWCSSRSAAPFWAASAGCWATSLLLLATATASGKRKLMQSILLFGATSRTKCILGSPSRGAPSASSTLCRTPACKYVSMSAR